MTEVLFVCTGNICRSPFAERYAALLVSRSPEGANWRFSSAGTGALAGADMDSVMAGELEVRGGRAEAFVARQLNRQLIVGADLIITMESRQRSWVLDDYPRLARQCFTLDQLRRALELLPSRLRGMDAVTAAGEARVHARRRDDIPDPFRLGPAPGALAASHIADALDRVLGRLLS